MTKYTVLLNSIENIQTLITCTGLDELIENFDRALSHPDNEDLDRLGRIIRKDFSK